MKLWYNYLLACRVINLGSFPTMYIIYYLFLLFMHDFICYLCRYYMNSTPHLERFYTEEEWDTSFLGNTSIFCTVPFCGFAQFVYDHFVDCMSKSTLLKFNIQCILLINWMFWNPYNFIIPNSIFFKCPISSYDTTCSI